MNRYTMMAFVVAAVGAVTVGYLFAFIVAFWLAGALAALAAINLIIVYTTTHPDERKHSEERLKSTP
jgi:hypothetical protein